MKYSVHVRCACVDPDGRPLGHACPKLWRMDGNWNSRHGSAGGGTDTYLGGHQAGQAVRLREQGRDRDRGPGLSRAARPGRRRFARNEIWAA